MPPSDVPLLGLLVALFYGAFTLLPDSHSLMVSWPWVFIWQIGLLCAVLWLLGLVWSHKELRGLGNGLDYLIGVAIVGLILSSALAEFPNQARWYAWAAVCFIAALYALNYWLKTPQRRLNLLIGQGYLNLVFIALSLGLWVSQTLMPELGRLQQIRQQFGVSLSFDFSEIQLRNWAPIGHQNYVAGYLMLAIPLLVGLCFTQRGWRRWLWGAGVGLGLIDLYTTSSRGGLLGMAAALVVGFAVLIWQSQIPRRWIGFSGVGMLAVVAIAAFTNPRLRSLLSGTNVSGELAYRLISATAGWQMGITHPFTGVGLGGELLLYQKYRPFWAGRVAEMLYQLHSTPIQLWANLGIWGILPMLGAIALLPYLALRWQKSTPKDDALNPILILSLLAGLLAYIVQSLTDYQLDNVCISGSLVIFLAVLASQFRPSSPLTPDSSLLTPHSSRLPQFLPIAGLATVAAIALSLIPIHRAWMLSSQGFTALSQLEDAKTPQERQDSLNAFEQNLTQAQTLAPWEPYYAYQLGWTLGDLGLRTGNSSLVDRAIPQWIKGNQAAPYQEFGQTNLGWLLLDRDAKSATQTFERSAQLVPAKRGMFYSLGISLLGVKPELAVEAIVLELLRDPMLISSPIWKTPQLQSIYTQVLEQLETQYDALLQKHSQPGIFNTYLHNSRGLLYWWTENLTAARSDLQPYGNDLSRTVLDLAEGKPSDPQKIQNTAGGLTIAAWLNPAQRLELLQKAWITENRAAPPPEIMQQLVDSMTKSTSFDQWLKQNAPSREARRSRQGFGIVSRHVDGPIPKDFSTIVENIPLNNLLKELLSSQIYFPELDGALQSDREALLAATQ